MTVERDAAPARGGTSYDVARLAGVSQSAVSRSFRPGGSVSAATRARVIAAAEALGYRPNAMAQGLITRRSNLVAVVISNLTNLHYPEVLAELSARLGARDIRVLLFALAGESEIDAVLDQLFRYRVDGAIVAARLSAGQLAQFARYGVALVLYNRQDESAPVSSVCCDFLAGETLLIDGLIAAGCRRFAIIGGPPDSAVGEARMAGALARLARAGLADVPVDRGDFSYDGGFAAAERLLQRAPLDAICAVNDVMALGAMDAARALDLAVPGDVSVVGFDGVAPATWRAYDLTTIRQPVGRMAEAAVAMLLERIESPGVQPARRLFSGDLIRGGSARLG